MIERMSAPDNELEFLCSTNIEPLFWTPERLDYSSGWWGHVPFAFWIVTACKPRLLLELGTHHGVSYTAFCEAIARSQLDARCYAVDNWAGDPHAGSYDDQVYNDFKAFHDSRYASFSKLLRMTFDEACGGFEDGTIDLLHIDGYHTYEAVRHDFETWRPKLSERAVVLFHDTNERLDDFGVWRFFGEMREAFPHFEFLHCHGLGLAAVGSNAPLAVERLCGLDTAAACRLRDRFAHLGARWMAAVERREIGQKLESLEHDLTVARDAHARVVVERECNLAWAKTLDKELTEALATLDRITGQKRELLASNSWRLTAPLRFAKRLIRG